MTTAKSLLLQWLTDGDLLRVITGLSALAKETGDKNLLGETTLLSGRYRQLLAERRQELLPRDDFQMDYPLHGFY